jgi:IS4 transposase
MYRRRWDIEVFFRFIKQELSFKHFVSTSVNGIMIMLYVTLMLAMLVLMYKKANELGYKTAKRRFNMEVEEVYLALIIQLSGGDPSLVFR